MPFRIYLRTSSGAPVAAGATRVTPEAQVLVVQGPFGAWGWNRPSAVLVERDGQTQ